MTVVDPCGEDQQVVGKVLQVAQKVQTKSVTCTDYCVCILCILQFWLGSYMQLFGVPHPNQSRQYNEITDGVDLIHQTLNVGNTLEEPNGVA